MNLAIGQQFVWLVVSFLCIGSVLARPQIDVTEEPSQKTCGYASCPVTKANMLNVHLVPHTHDDVGWLKTVDQYYYGSQTLIQKAGVQYILDSVVQELLRDAAKKFIYVESAYFFKWWREQTPELQDQVKMLVNEGRLEFIGGAWSMNDEATTHYQSIIDQFSWGLRRLNDTFGECGRPRIGWQIDPFGHSRQMASIFAQMRYDGLFFGRLDYQDKDQRLNTKTAEMIWKASPNLGDSSNLFTGALYNQYQAPSGFCFDLLCADEPIIDGKHSPDNNIESRISDFFKFINEQRKYYKTNNIIITMGGDFTFQDANVYFKNMDKLIRYANEKQANDSDINLFYSTPSCYLKSLHDAGQTWPTKDDDFFPYASDPHAYWTGYFVSRPTLKRFERVGNHFTQVCKQLTALSPQKLAQFLPHLNFMRETMGVMQHHDAVTGTEKQKVAYDYAKRLEVSLRACSSNTRAILNRLTTEEDQVDATTHDAKVDYKFEFKTCSLLNISMCDISEKSERFVLTLYNPLARSTCQYVRLPVKGHDYEVMDYRNVSIESQIVPVPTSVRSLNFRRSSSNNELVFLASELPPMGYKSFYISKTEKQKSSPVPEVILVKRDSSMKEIGNDNLRLTFDSNGYMVSMKSKGVSRLITQDFSFYEGATGNNLEFRNRSSGAYIFRPKTAAAKLVGTTVQAKIIKGPVVEEVHQVFNEWISQVVRVYHTQNYAEFEWLVGPIPIADGIGKEVISRFDTEIKSNGIFYTDSNGREMLERERNHRDTWKLNIKEKVAGNYYPLTTKIALEDENSRLAVLIDRAQGGSSLKDGSLEIMIHRRLLHDDDFGVGEALNETAYGMGLVARGHHYLFFDSSEKSMSPTLQAHERIVQLEKLLPAWMFLSDASQYSYNDWTKNFTNIYSGLTLSLPQNINLMSYEPWHENELLVRFEHILEKDEDPELSNTVSFNLKDVFGKLDIDNVRETTLDGNQWIEDNQRLEFVADPDGTTYESMQKSTRTARKLQRAQRPAVSAKFSDELIVDEPQSNTAPLVQHNKLRSQKLSKIQLDIEETGVQDDDDIFTVEMNPMQICTFILTLQQQI